ncbi:MAG: hypothetical protein HY243_07710 [Proteobacteria bacterium]|nr:hypothetical protein [Pseudomonadota bacterium]
MKAKIALVVVGIAATAPASAEAAMWRVYLPPYVPAPQFSVQTWELIATFDDKGGKMDGTPIDPCDSESLDIAARYKEAGDIDKARRALEIACVSVETGRIERISNE